MLLVPLLSTARAPKLSLNLLLSLPNSWDSLPGLKGCSVGDLLTDVITLIYFCISLHSLILLIVTLFIVALRYDRGNQ